MLYFRKRKAGDNLISRIKEIRKLYKLTQEEFGEKINLKQNSIALIETGKRNPSDRTILDICREFNVNEEWLRTGQGEMFIELDREEELASWFGTMLNPNNDNEFIKKFIHMLSKLDVNDWKVLEKMALLMVEEKEKD